MATTTGNTDSNLSGKPSDNIDKQKGPATGSNAESAGSTLNAGKIPVDDTNNPANQGSTKQGESSGDSSNPQKQGSSGGAK